MPTLYSISGDLNSLDQLLTELNGELTDDEVEKIIDGWLEEITGARDEKVDAYCGLIREIEARREARHVEAKRLYDLAMVDENAVIRLKERLFWFFEAHGIQKLETVHFKVSVANNGGQQPINVKYPPNELPEEFQKLSVSADMKKLREVLETGETLPFAELLERGRHLRIR
jgi:hypothetical protein